MNRWIIQVFDEALDRWENRYEFGIIHNKFIAQQIAKDLEKEEGQWKSIKIRIVPYFENRN